MKKWLSIVLALTLSLSLMSAAAIPASADKFTDLPVEGDFQYGLINDDTAVIITDYFGAGGDVVIPGTIAGLPVVSLYTQVFDGHPGVTVTGITFPASMRHFSLWALQGLENLETITVEEGNPVFHSEGNCLIETETKTLILGSQNSVIPTDGSVTAIGEAAFAGCKGLTSITIPDCVTELGDGAFAGTGLTSVVVPDGITTLSSTFLKCSELTDVTLPDSVTILVAFSECTSLASIDIPDSVTHIGGFDGCTALTSVTLPDGVTDILGGAFKGSGLTEITIPDGVTHMGQEAFHDTPWYDAHPSGMIYVGNWVCGYKGTPGPDSMNFREGTVGIADYAFWSFEYQVAGTFDNLRSVTMPDSLKYIGQDAFMGCDRLMQVRFSNNLTEIGDYAFSDCISLTQIDLPQSVTRIGTNAFQRCSKLARIALPVSVTEIGKWAFFRSDSIETVYYGGTEADRDRIEVAERNQPLLDAAWVYEAAGLPSVSGDANDDGALDMKDVLLTRRFIAGEGVLLNTAAADVNGDKSVDMKDVLTMRKMIAGLLPVSD